MEGNKKSSSSSKSSSSFTSDLFGSKESSASSSSGIFGSIFPPPNKTIGRESLHSEEFYKKQDFVTQGTRSRSSEDYSQGMGNNERSPYYQEQRVQQPCHLSSSIYYGGQDVYSEPFNPQASRTINRDGGEDDSGSASRGNWWKGSLYY